MCVVMLQPVIGGYRPDADCPHKFIVETIYTPDGELTSLERLVNNTFIGPGNGSRSATYVVLVLAVVLVFVLNNNK